MSTVDPDGRRQSLRRHNGGHNVDHGSENSEENETDGDGSSDEEDCESLVAVFLITGQL